MKALKFQLLATQRRGYRASQDVAQQEGAKTSSVGNYVKSPQNEHSVPSIDADHLRLGTTSFFRRGRSQDFDKRPSRLEDRVRQLMRRTPQSVVIVTSVNDNLDEPELAKRYRGATLSSFTVVSLQNKHPVVSFNLKRHSSVFKAIRYSRRFCIHFPSPTKEAVALVSNFSSGKHPDDVELFREIPTLGTKDEPGEWNLRQYPLVSNRGESPIYGSLMCTWLRGYTQYIDDHVVIYGDVRTSFHPPKLDPELAGLGYVAGEYFNVNDTTSSLAQRNKGAYSDSHQRPHGIRSDRVAGITQKEQLNNRPREQAQKTEDTIREEREKKLIERVEQLEEKMEEYGRRRFNNKSKIKSEGRSKEESSSAASPKSGMLRFKSPHPASSEAPKAHEWGSLGGKSFYTGQQTKDTGNKEFDLPEHADAHRRREVALETPETLERFSIRHSLPSTPFDQLLKFYRSKHSNFDKQTHHPLGRSKIKSFIDLKPGDAAKLSEILTRAQKTEEGVLMSKASQGQTEESMLRQFAHSALLGGNTRLSNRRGSRQMDEHPVDLELKTFLDQLADEAKKRTEPRREAKAEVTM